MIQNSGSPNIITRVIIICYDILPIALVVFILAVRSDESEFNMVTNFITITTRKIMLTITLKMQGPL